MEPNWEETMTDPNEPRRDEPPATLSDQIGAFIAPGRDNVLLIYILYLVGMIPALGIVPIVIGFVMALLNRDQAGPMERSHYEYQFRQALMGLLFAAVSGILVLVFVGFIGLAATAIWWIVRSVRGLIAINHREPIPDPRTWTW